MMGLERGDIVERHGNITMSGSVAAGNSASPTASHGKTESSLQPGNKLCENRA